MTFLPELQPPAGDLAPHDGQLLEALESPGLTYADQEGVLHSAEFATILLDPNLRLLTPDSPVVVLTGDIRRATVREIAEESCSHLTKPVTTDAQLGKVREIMAECSGVPGSAHAACSADRSGLSEVVIIDDDPDVRTFMQQALEHTGHHVRCFETGEAFTRAMPALRESARGGCILVDANLAEMSGLDVLQRIRDDGLCVGVIMVNGRNDVTMAVKAMKAGARDFLQKPIDTAALLTAIEGAGVWARNASASDLARTGAAARLAKLTVRERQIMDLVLDGHPSKNIAADLGINQRTVENHRASIMKKAGVRSLPALARLAITAA